MLGHTETAKTKGSYLLRRLSTTHHHVAHVSNPPTRLELGTVFASETRHSQNVGLRPCCHNPRHRPCDPQRGTLPTITGRANCRNWPLQVNRQFQKFSPFLSFPGRTRIRTVLPDGPAGVDCSSVRSGFLLEKTSLNSQRFPKLSAPPVEQPPPPTDPPHGNAATKREKRRNNSVSASIPPVFDGRPAITRAPRESETIGR